MNDLTDTKAGRAIKENSSHYFLLGQKSQSIETLKEKNELPLGSGGYELLKTVHTVPGSYSEIFCLMDTGAGIVRLIVDSYRQLLYSTKAEDVQAIADLRKQGMTVDEAIKMLLERKGLSHAA